MLIKINLRYLHDLVKKNSQTGCFWVLEALVRIAEFSLVIKLDKNSPVTPPSPDYDFMTNKYGLTLFVSTIEVVNFN